MSGKLDPRLYQLWADQVRDYAIFFLDADGYIKSWNAGAAHIKQYSASEIIGQHFSVFYTAADIARNWPAYELKRTLLEGRFEDEGWRVRKDGTTFWANVIITAIRDEHGILLAYSKITRDLTARKRYEETLRQSEERFRLLVNGVQDYAIYMLSPEGAVTSWNEGAHRIKGYDATEIIGKHYSQFYVAEDVEKGKPLAALAIAKEQGRCEDEGWRLRKDGSKFWARTTITPLYNSNNVLYGFAKVTQDLTQRRHAEALESSTHQVNDFIAVLAHELRNPLAAIRNAVHLQRIADLGESMSESARKIIDRQSGQLAHIVDDLLDISRVTRGTLSMDKKPSDVATIIERAIETARPAIDAGRHLLEIDLPSERADVNGDELRLTQALTNIINNAARYTDPGGRIVIKVALSDSEEPGNVCISVQDTGRGIEPHLLNSVFGMFVQGKDPLHRPAAGLGVGLALARSIVELHNGTVQAKSSGMGKGAEFIICLPRLRCATPPDSVEQRKEAEDMAFPIGNLSKCRILVVDDNVDAAIVLASLLTKHGHEALAVHDGVEAIRAFDGFHPEIVLLDLGMPEVNGLEVVRRLRERNRSPRPLIVALTGWGSPEDALRSRDAGFDFHLVKPVEEPQLFRILETHFRLAHTENYDQT